MIDDRRESSTMSPPARRFARGSRTFLGLLAATIIVTSAAAQTMNDQAAPAKDKACTPQERANKTLSEKLDQTAGVICPPDIDPAIKAPTPSGGNTPVIPPPGSPGGDQSVQPK